MNKIMVAAIVAVLIQGSYAATNAVQASSQPQKRFRVGGRVGQPNTARGYVAIVNAQDKVSIDELKAATESIRKDDRYTFTFFKTVDEARGASMIIKFIDDPNKPVLTAAPEDSWAHVNVANLVNDLKSDEAKAKFLPLRARKELLRAFCYAAGAGGSAYKKNILDVASPRDLDYWGEFLPVDALERAKAHLKTRGLVPERYVTYRTACYEGWAPAPRDEVEKGIWDETHELPSEPITIKPPAKK